PSYLWQTLSKAMQELPHGLDLPGVQLGCSPLRQDDMKVCRALPVIPAACALQSFMRCCCELSAARLGVASTTRAAKVAKNVCRIFVSYDVPPRRGFLTVDRVHRGPYGGYPSWGGAE